MTATPAARRAATLEANESACGKYGALVKNARILDTEKYGVSVID